MAPSSSFFVVPLVPFTVPFTAGSFVDRAEALGVFRAELRGVRSPADAGRIRGSKYDPQ